MIVYAKTLQILVFMSDKRHRNTDFIRIINEIVGLDSSNAGEHNESLLCRFCLLPKLLPGNLTIEEYTHT